MAWNLGELDVPHRCQGLRSNSRTSLRHCVIASWSPSVRVSRKSLANGQDPVLMAGIERLEQQKQ